MTYVLKPHRSLLIVQEDPVPGRTDSGLFLPDGYQVPWSGVILERGPWASEHFAAGRRMLYRPRAGYFVGSEGIGKEGAVRILHSDHVLAMLDGGAEVLEMTSAEWAEIAKAPPGNLLVERVEIPLVRGRIHLPDGARVHVRSNEVLIRSIGEGVEGFRVGQRCLIAQAIGEEIRFGDREEIRLWKLDPEGIVADVVTEDETLRMHGEDPESLLPESPLPDAEVELAYDEGDSRGIL